MAVPASAGVLFIYKLGRELEMLLRRTVILLLFVILFGLTLTAHAQGKAKAKSKLTPTEARSIAREVFLWGMHPVAIYHLRYNFAQNDNSPRYVGINRLSWDRKPQKALPRLATTPNATTLYGAAMLDLSKEPVVITVPEIKDHYWSIQLHDNYARCWHMIGNLSLAPRNVVVSQ